MITTSEIWRVLQIVWLDLLLSGDNAVVIALASRTLPEKQRKLASALGAGGAVCLRVVLAAMLLAALQAPFLKLVGGAFLVWIAAQLPFEGKSEDSIRSGRSLGSAVRIIVFADALMSLDNVLAITAAARGDPWLVLFGLLVSLPLVVFGATLFVRLLHWIPWLVWLSVALIGWTAGQMAAGDPIVLRRFGALSFEAELVAGVAGAAAAIIATCAWRQMRRPSRKA